MIYIVRNDKGVIVNVRKSNLHYTHAVVVLTSTRVISYSTHYYNVPVGCTPPTNAVEVELANTIQLKQEVKDWCKERVILSSPGHVTHPIFNK